MTFLLGPYAARTCPVKTQNAFDPTCAASSAEPDESLAQLFDGGAAFAADVLDRLALAHRGRLVDLRAPVDPTPAGRRRACVEALESGAELVLGGWLPVDVAGQRRGQPDLLVRGADQEDGRPRYHPVDVRWHKVIERRGVRREPGSDPWLHGGAGPGPAETRSRAEGSAGPAGPAGLSYTTVNRPRPMPVKRLEGHGVRTASREADLIQLAHHHRILEAAGYAAADDARAAVIGTDSVLGEPVLAWVGLAEPLVRTFSRTEPEGWRLRSMLERYDHEYAFRLAVAAVAARQSGHPDSDPALLVRPIVTDECGRCPWWEHCRPQLDPDDVSLRIDKGPLDVREIATLRSHGIQTITDLAAADLPSLLTSYLPEVTHRRGAESRLRVATRRAGMLLSGSPLERETAGPIELPGADIEVDFDIETSADGRIYLWGFLVNDSRSERETTYHAFSRFEDLDPTSEVDLARRALSWLQGQVAGERSVRVYHYSSYEVAAIRALAERVHDPLFDWALEYANEQFVDLLEVVQANYFGVAGLGLKVVAQQGAGFHWRDEDPGGLNSQRWFAEALHEQSASARKAARQRVLDYNEDDVIATARVRAWLRAS